VAKVVSVRVLSQRASFWVAAAVAVIALWTSGAPTVTYPLYAAEWNLSPSVTTAIFAVYPLVLVVVLLVFGNLSDHIGRRSTILIGLSASLLGVLLFAIAPHVGWVFVGRALMGVGVGLSLSPATAAMVEFSAAGKEGQASALTTASTAVGLILATLVGGGLIEYAPFPTHLNFWILAAVVAAVLATAWFLPRHTSAEAAGRWKPRPLSIPRALRGTFAKSALAITAAYGLGAIVLSLGADIGQELIGSDNSLVNGAVIAINAATIAITAIAARKLRGTTDIVIGGATATVGMAIMIVSSVQHSLPLFIVSAVVTGVGYSLLFLGGLSVINADAPAHHRAGTLSGVYLIAYLFQGLIALLLGGAATASGLGIALDFGAVIVAILGLGSIVLVTSLRGRKGGAAPQLS
jgi:predicted MFS family arabinose efflux permease